MEKIADKKSFSLSLKKKKPAAQVLTVFLASLILMLLVMVPYVILDKGNFIYIGDFNCQQIPFYIEANESIRSGQIGWNWNTDLGANFIGSYAFYLIGSPFFWLTLLLPMSAVAGSIPFLIALKTAVAAATGFAFIRRFVKNPDFAFLGGLLYAFSGFSLYNIFFNHFHDIIAFFPLLLLGLEKLMEDKKKGFFCFAVFLNALTNYYFFVAEAVFMAVYIAIRVCSGGWRKADFKRWLCLVFEAGAGFLLAAFVVLPAVLTTLQIGRAGEKLSGWALLTYYEPQRPLQILQAFFLPPEICSSPNVFPEAGAKWSSVTAWLPLFGFCGVMTYLRRRPRDFFSRLSIALLIMAFVPVLNAAFQLFSNNFYTRWFFAFVLILSLMTVKALEECSFKEWKWGIFCTAPIALGLCIPQTLILNTQTGERGLCPNMPLLYTYIAVTALSLGGVLLLLYLAEKERIDRLHGFAALLPCFIVLFSVFYVGICHGSSSIADHDLYVTRNIEARERMTTELKDGDRIDTVNTETNAGMYWNMPTIRAFHSVVPGSIFDFYKAVGVTRDVKTDPDLNDDALHALTSVRYLFDGDLTEEHKYDQYTYIGEDNQNRVYSFDGYIPMGFSYESFLPESVLNENFASGLRTKKMLNSICIPDEQMALVKDILVEDDSVYLRPEQTDAVLLAAERGAHTAENFTVTASGFTCDFSAEKPRILFFSVPYEAGWRASVNGESAEIIRANIGFMAVICPAGENHIEFTYQTPGLIPGLIAAGAALLGILVYLGFDLLKKKQICAFPSCENKTDIV